VLGPTKASSGTALADFDCHAAAGPICLASHAWLRPAWGPSPAGRAGQAAESARFALIIILAAGPASPHRRGTIAAQKGAFEKVGPWALSRLARRFRLNGPSLRAWPAGPVADMGRRALGLLIEFGPMPARRRPAGHTASAPATHLLTGPSIVVVIVVIIVVGAPIKVNERTAATGGMPPLSSRRRRRRS
jgi:hypothetical protein